MFKFEVPNDINNRVTEYILINVAQKNGYVTNVQKSSESISFFIPENDIYKLQRIPIEQLGYSKKKLAFVEMEWLYFVNYLLEVYYVESGNFPE